MVACPLCAERAEQSTVRIGGVDTTMIACPCAGNRVRVLLMNVIGPATNAALKHRAAARGLTNTPGNSNPANVGDVVTFRGTRQPDGNIRWVMDKDKQSITGPMKTESVVTDPLAVTYDGVCLRALLDGDEFNRQERGGAMWRAKRMTPAQRAAVSAHWSLQLKLRVAAKDAADKERERNVVTMDGEEW